MTNEKTVLITGCSSGFGKLTAKTFANKNWNVIATMRTPENEKELTELKNVQVKKLDVTDLNNINNVIDEVLNKFGKIDVVVNNAGRGGYGLFEQFSEDDIRAMFETNLFGPINVMRAILPHMRKCKNGTIINVTSMAGMVGLPNCSIYSSTKFSLEGLTEAMALEYKHFNISIKSVLPGSYPTTRFNTNAGNKIDIGDDELQTYAQSLQSNIKRASEQMSMQSGKLSDPEEVANKIYECATSNTPIVNPVGADSQMILNMVSEGSKQKFLDQLSSRLLPK